MLSKEPVRIQRDWETGVVAHCDFCSHSEMTVPHTDGGRICASCCDSEFLSDWQNYAKSLTKELLSLREQLAELKALEPCKYMVVGGDGEDIGTTNSLSDAEYMAIRYSGNVIPLFTAAKPAEIPRHIFSMLVNELRDVPAIGCKRELIIGVLNSHGIVAKPAEDKC